MGGAWTRPRNKALRSVWHLGFDRGSPRQTSRNPSSQVSQNLPILNLLEVEEVGHTQTRHGSQPPCLDGAAASERVVRAAGTAFVSVQLLILSLLVWRPVQRQLKGRDRDA